MPAYLVTGSPGVGKTAVQHELTRRGFLAYNTDDLPEVCYWHDPQTGETLKTKPTQSDYHRFVMSWDIAALKKLLVADNPVFICAITFNTMQNLGLFDKIFALHVSTATLKHRLQTRTTNDYGKDPKKLEGILRDHDGSDAFWRAHGAVVIDAEQSVQHVVDDIIAHIQ